MNEFSDILITVSLVVIMFGIGLSISFADFRQVFARPKAVITGLVCQMVILPVIAFLIAFLSPIGIPYKVGLILIACCPGGTASNLVTLLLKGRVALSVSMTSLNSFLIIFTIPALLGLAMNIFMHESSMIRLSLPETIGNVSISVILPVISGIYFKNWQPAIADSLNKPLRYILPGILLFVFGYLLFFDKTKNYSGEIMEHLPLMIPVVLLNLSSIVAGYYLSGLVALSHESRYTIGIEMGLQNSALAIYIADQLLENQEMVTVALLYSSFSFFTTIGLAYLLKIKFRTKDI